MRIKCLLALVLGSAMVAPAAYAYDYSYLCPNYIVSYPYVGVMFDWIKLQNSVQVLFPDNGTPNPAINDGTDFSSAQAIGSADLGMVARWGKWYFAGEASTQPFRITDTQNWVGNNTGMPYYSKVQLTDVVNLDAIPGYYITPKVLMYVRGGVAFSKLVLQQNNFLGTDYSYQKTVAAPRFGVGFDFAVAKNLGLGVDYIYTYYATLKNGRDIPTPTGQLPATFQIKSYTNQLGLHLTYKFDYC